MEAEVIAAIAAAMVSVIPIVLFSWLSRSDPMSSGMRKISR
jgi:hypothetical protein